MPPKPAFDEWRRASYSLASGECVEASSCNSDGFVGVRDSKNQNGSVLVYTSREWKSFIADVKI
jgi:hypothetical protein